MAIVKENYMIEGQPKRVDKRKKKFNKYKLDDLTLALHKVGTNVYKAAQSHGPVFIQGGSGITNELVARSVHMTSSRYKNNFVLVHCASISNEFLDLELFGYRQISSCSSVTVCKGKFELANQGTLFLDGIDELNFKQQKKLLHVLQDKTITRVSDTKPISVDVRIIVSSHTNLGNKANNGNFSRELLHHLNNFQIQIPKLKRGIEDFSALVHSITKNIKTKSEHKHSIKPEAIQALNVFLRSSDKHEQSEFEYLIKNRSE